MAVPEVLREVEGMAKAYLTRKHPRISLSGFVCVSDDGFCWRSWGVGRGMREELDLRLKRENQILSREMIDL